MEDKKDDKMVKRSTKGRHERNGELEAMREEMREHIREGMKEIQNELREALHEVRAQGSERSRGSEALEDFDHLQGRSLPNNAIMNQMEAMKMFMVMQPPSFAGEPNVEEAENWLRRIKRILDMLDIPAGRRVNLATYMLIGKADFWWETMKRVHNTEAMNWKQFERIFLDKYFGDVAKQSKRMEFEHLIQGTMTVEEYESHFTELSRFALGIITEEGEKARRFEQGLRPSIRSRIVPLAIRDYSDLVKRALLVEHDINNTNQMREHEGDRKGKQKERESSQRKPHNQLQRQRYHPYRGHLPFHGGDEQNPTKQATRRTCYACGAEDHLLKDCLFRGPLQDRFQLHGNFQSQITLPFQPPQLQLPYHQAPQLSSMTPGARTSIMTSQTRSSQRLMLEVEGDQQQLRFLP